LVRLPQLEDSEILQYAQGGATDEPDPHADEAAYHGGRWVSQLAPDDHAQDVPDGDPDQATDKPDSNPGTERCRMGHVAFSWV
jgi:hypothetical protein